MRNLELLAPAGNLEMLRAAIENGADAVYMGLTKYNARVMTNNFTKEEYIEAIDYAHKRKAKIFLTLNTLLETEEVEDAIEDLIDLYEAGLDAVILQDIGLANVIHKIMPDLEMHASTQMSVTNLKQVKFLEKMGYTRVVLGRELTIPEIKEICNNTKLEVEVFVHGALCVSVSGQCLLSSLIGGRSGNKGACAQPCRTKFRLYNKSDDCLEKTYLLSKKDIYGLDHVKKLIDAGITSFKIEGRNKPSYYVATSIEKYRKYIDNASEVSKEDEKELLQVFNRSGKSYGYLNKVERLESITKVTPKNTGLVLGKVIEQNKQFIKIKLNEKIDMQDGIEIVNLEKENTYSTIVTCIRDEKYNIINKEVEKGNIVWLGDIKDNVAKNSIIYKTTDRKLNKKLEYTWKTSEAFKKKIDISAYLKVSSKEKLTLILEEENKKVVHTLDYIPEKASNVAATIESISKNLCKTNNTVYNIQKVEIDLEEGIYLPVSIINQIRREATKKLENLYLFKRDVTNINEKKKKELESIVKIKDIPFSEKVITKSTYMLRYNKDKLTEISTKRIYVNLLDYINNKSEILAACKNKKIYIMLPNVAFKNTMIFIEKNLENISKEIAGIIISNIGDIEICRKIKKENKEIELIANNTLNVTNLYSALFYLELGINKFTMMPDISEKALETFKKKLDIENVTLQDIAMTSRYCILGSFVNKSEICTAPCTKDEYYLLDQKDSRLDIVCNRLDCTMQIIKKVKTYTDKEVSVRENII